MRFPSPQKLMTSNTPINPNPYPWEQWSRLPKEERDAELKEAAKEYASFDQDDAVGHHIVRPPFPFFDSVEVEAVEEPCYTDFIMQQGLQKQEVSADTSGFDWFQMHHDDGIMDGHLDVDHHAAPAGGDQGSHDDPLTGGPSGQWDDNYGFEQNPFRGAGWFAGLDDHGNDPSSVPDFGSHPGASAACASRDGEGAPGSHTLIHFEPSTFIGGGSPHLSRQGNAGCATVDEPLLPNVDPGQHTNQDLLA